MRAQHQLRNFSRALELYGGEIPLARFLKEFFRRNRQMGAADRRGVSRLLYTYYRLGKAAKELPEIERLAIALFLCAPSDEVLAYLRPDLHALAALPLSGKIAFLEADPAFCFTVGDVFPYSRHFSDAIDGDIFCASLFTQPDLFIRPHPGKRDQITAALTAVRIPFSEEGDALRLPNSTKLDQVFPDQRLFEVQDLSSQQTGDFFRPGKWDKWWDACAASGGKSILLSTQQPDISLVVSDVRESILDNLGERFRNAGIRRYQKKLLDLTESPEPVLHDYEFDGIILDAPCTGSGTWGRSPEMISQFEESSIRNFQSLQRSIASNVVNYLKPGKPLIYITCSVFKEENEDMTAYLAERYGFTSESSCILKGYETKADTMYVSRLIRNSG
jgi:16S rRNA (cytosine967-C5)-methyltransferase